MTEELKTLTAKVEDVASRMGRIEEQLAALAVFFASDRSRTFKPGPRMALRPRLPGRTATRLVAPIGICENELAFM